MMVGVWCEKMAAQRGAGGGAKARKVGYGG
jgi:hypothetical protein